MIYSDRTPDFENDKLRMWTGDDVGHEEASVVFDMEHEEMYESRVYEVVDTPESRAFLEDTSPILVAMLSMGALTNSGCKVLAKRRKVDGMVWAVVKMKIGGRIASVPSSKWLTEDEYRESVKKVEEVPLWGEPLVTTYLEYKAWMGGEL